MAYKFEQIMKILAILGGFIALIAGILDLAGFGFGIGGYWGIPNANWLNPIIAIILAILVLLCAFRGNPIPFTWVWLLILGILILIFGSWLAGVLVILAGILGLVK